MHLSKRANTAVHAIDLFIAMLQSNFSNIFYKIIKEVVEVCGSEEKDNKARQYLFRRKRFEQVLFAFYFLRVFYLQYLIANNFPQNIFWKVDYVAHFVRDNPSYDFLFFACLTLLGIFIFIATQRLYINSKKKFTAWNIFYVLVVQNIDAYRCCTLPKEEIEEKLTQKRKDFLAKTVFVYKKNNQNFFWKFFTSFVLFQKYYIKLSSHLSLLYNLDYVNKRALTGGRGKLVIPLELPLDLRIRLLRGLLLIEKAMVGYQVSFFVVFLITGILHLHIFIRPSLLYLPLVLLDHFCVHYIFRLLVKSGIYCFLCYVTFTINGYKCRFYRRLIRLFISKHQNKGHFRSHSFRLQVEARLTTFMREHTVLCHQVVHGNKQMWAFMMLSFLATNLPSNIYLLIRLFLSKNESTEDSELQEVDRAAIGVVFTAQTAVVAVVLGILAQQCKSLHSFAFYVPAIQQILQAGNGCGNFKILSLKLKYDLMLQRLTTGRPYSVSIGPLWTITYDTLIQIFFAYIYYVLFGLTWKRQHLDPRQILFA